MPNVSLLEVIYNKILTLSNNSIDEDRAWKRLDPEEQQKFIQTKKLEFSPINKDMFRNMFEDIKKEGLYIQFSETDLLAVRPRATHNYRGIYGWNISDINYDMFVKSILSNWKEREYMIVFKPKNKEKILVANSYTKFQLENDLDQLAGVIEPKYQNKLIKNLDDYLNLSSNPYYCLIDVLNELFVDTGKKIYDKSTKKHTEAQGVNYATPYLKKIGYDGVLIDEEIIIFHTADVEIVSINKNPLKKK